jgi:squalene-associated FAD-dependent desaturase
MTAPHVVVIGGGLAGLSAAIACTDGGMRVTVLESRPRLGGATWSFERNGLFFDNGQHVYLRCCVAYRRFLERIGTAELAPLQERLAIPVLKPRPGGEAKVAWIRRAGLPAPLHLTPALLRYSHLSIADRLRSGLAVRALDRLNLADPALDDETFGHFLARHGQSPAAIEALFGLIALPTTNVAANEVSLLLAAKVFKTGLLADADAADLGWSTVPLQALHADPAVAVLERAGATIERRTRVDSFVIGTDASDRPVVKGVQTEAGEISADAVILATSHEGAASLLPAGGTVDPAALAGLGTSPIIDVHVVYDRVVSPYPVAAGIGTPAQFIFDRTGAAGLAPGEGQCLAVSISGADAEHGDRPEVLIDRYTRALAELFPAARNATVRDAVVTREHAATFRGVPGTARLRPGANSGFAGLSLAGSWTDTGWPATMEGAVRSGTVAAARTLSGLRGRTREEVSV